MELKHLLASLLLMSCLTGSLGRSGVDQGTGINCVKTADADGGPKCPSYQIALCCDTSETSQNCNAASGTACKDLYRQPRSEIQPFCCDEMDMPGCVNIESPENRDVSCTVLTHPSQERFCCARAGTVNIPYTASASYGEGQQGGLDCEDLYDMPKCPKKRPISFCC